MSDNIIEIEESFDPTTKVYIEVKRVAVKQVWVSERAFDTGLCEKQFDVVGDLEAVHTRIVSTTVNRSDYVNLKVLQSLDQLFCAKGYFSTSDLQEKYKSLNMEVREVE